VLLLDEPMSALDARLREQLRREIKRIQQDLGVTTVYVTHDQEEALAVSDRLAVMHDGSVEQVGTPVEVYEGPGTQFVASFVGENNLFTGTVTGTDEAELVVDVADGSEEQTFHIIEDDATTHKPGDTISFCVRPTHLSPEAPANRFPVSLETAEYLGGTARIYGEWAGREIVLRLPEPVSGDLTVGFEPGDATVL
jgi:thiamine transport system ATP-binding protein